MSRTAVDALIGYTGFVGNNLLRQRRFDGFFNAGNLDTIRGRRFDLLVCAATPAVMYRANLEPEEDLAVIRKLLDALQSVEARKVVLVSTIYVYREPVDVDERHEPDEHGLLPYGKHRLMLEQWVRARFDTAAIRLPNIFGPGIKKNVLFDLLTQNQLDRVHSLSSYQYYDLGHLWRDVTIALDHDLPVLNVATEPVTVREIARDGLGHDFDRVLPTPPVLCDFHTQYARLWDKPGPYLYTKAEVLADIRRFAAEFRRDGFDLAVSSIAWRPDEDEEMRGVLAGLGVVGIELSPDRLLGADDLVSERRVDEQRRFWSDAGLSVVAVQGVLFRKDHLRLFESEDVRAQTRHYLAEMIGHVARLGAKVLMFGSPKNRRRGTLSKTEADRIAVPFFRDLAGIAYRHGVAFCIEPNPPAYGADYVETTAEACALAEQVNHPGFGVNVDTGAMLAAGESAQVLAVAARRMRHVHISRPRLDPVWDIGVDPHTELAAILRTIHYEGWLSIEMGKDPGPGVSNVERVSQAVRRVKEVYFPRVPPSAGPPGRTP